MFQIQRRMISRAAMCAALVGPIAVVGCGEPQSMEESGENGENLNRRLGTVELALLVSDAIDIQNVDYAIEGDNGVSRAGSANVHRSGMLSFRVGGLRPGNYDVTLSALDSDDQGVLCEGTASFAVAAGETSLANVNLQCRLPRRTGSVRVTGEFNVCPLIEEVTVLPDSVEVGGSVALLAVATDLDEEPVAYEWSTTGGEIAAPNEAETSLLCTEPGVVTVTLRVNDGDCDDTLTTTVTCTEPEGGEEGEAVLVWNEVESNGGTPDDWAELYNAGDAAQDLTGWSFKDNDDTHIYEIPAGTTIEPGDYLVLENYGFGLGGADSLRLFDPDMNLVVTYEWTAHAPTTYGRCPDVTGAFAITTVSTKGAPNDCSPTILVNEVESSGGTPGDWVELYNGGLNTADVGGWVLKDSADGAGYTLPAGTTIAPGAYLVLEEAAFGFGLGGADTARLFDAEGTLQDSYAWAAHATTSYGRCPNGGGEFTTTASTTKGVANDCEVSVKLNEVESNGGTPGDWVELINTGLGTVDVSGWGFKDNDDSRTFTIAAGTTLAPGAYLVLEEAVFGLGLGGGDSARLYDAAGALVDSYVWTSHAVSTYGRCPNGEGDFVATTSSKGAVNDCPLDPNVPAPWPGAAEVLEVDPAGAYPADLSGLYYQPAVAPDAAALWGIINGEGRLHRLVQTGAQWLPTAGDWATGKLVTYPSGTGRPDSEGVTKAELDAPGLYISTERNNDANGVSRLSVLRVDETFVGTPLVASHEWNLTAQLPVVGANLGLEAITWIPDGQLVELGFIDSNTGVTYDPADYADHGTGLFVVGVEGTGDLHVLALDHVANTATVIATVDSGHVGVMSLEYDCDNDLLWAGCDNTCGNQTTVLEVVSGVLTITARFSPPAGLPQSNNEGFTFAPDAECIDGVKRVFWSDDSNAFSHALRQGTIACGDFF
jgi:hypothetical protein